MVEARIPLHKDGDVLGVLLEEPGHSHHHVGLDVAALLAVAEEHEVLQRVRQAVVVQSLRGQAEVAGIR